MQSCRLWFESMVPVALSSPGIPVRISLVCALRCAWGTLCGPPASPWPHPGSGQGLGRAARPLAKAAAEDRGVLERSEELLCGSGTRAVNQSCEWAVV